MGSLHRIPPAYGSLVLDVGCGEFKRGDVGVDKRALPTVDFVVDLDRDPLPFGDNTFDRVVSYHFLEHTENPVRILCEMVRVCKVHGIVYLEVPHRWSRGACAKNPVHGFHKCVFNVGWFTRFASVYGLSCTSTMRFGMFFRPRDICVELFKRG